MSRWRLAGENRGRTAVLRLKGRLGTSRPHRSSPAVAEIRRMARILI